jgi:hypothetical protein
MRADFTRTFMKEALTVYTSICLLAASVLSGADLVSPSWHTDYYRARQLSASEQRPLAVVLGSGRGGWEQLNLDETARRLLADHYVPVYIDTSTPEGGALTAAFDIRSGQGLVLSDRGGERQAFWHEGPLSSADLVHNLQKVAVLNVASSTQTTAGVRTSYYPTGSVQPTGYANPYPSLMQQNFGGFAAGCST